MRIIMKLGEETSNHAISRPSWFLKGGNQIIYWWEDRNLNVTACCRFVELAVDLSSSTPSLSAEAQKKSPIVDNLNGAALSLLHPAPSNLVGSESDPRHQLYCKLKKLITNHTGNAEKSGSQLESTSELASSGR